MGESMMIFQKIRNTHDDIPVSMFKLEKRKSASPHPLTFCEIWATGGRKLIKRRRGSKRFGGSRGIVVSYFECVCVCGCVRERERERETRIAALLGRR
jgi:hypothetical protein